LLQVHTLQTINNVLMKTRFLFFAILLFTFKVSLSQGAPDLPRIVPATPNVAELGKYGTFPVAMNTGIPEIKFILFNIKVNEVSIPISLSYHAGGIRVNQEATDVGLGWSIQGGGVIHRNVLGIADELSLGNFNTVPYSINELVTLYGGTGQDREDNYHELKYLADGAVAMRDTQPDLFSFNMEGSSGQFIYSRDRTYLTIPYQPLRIVRDIVGNNFYFEITNESGTKYRFRNTTGVFYNENPNKNYEADWYLTDVISNNKKDTIQYEYETKAYSKIMESQYQVIGRELENISGIVSPELTNSDIEYSSVQIWQQELKMKKILWNQGEVVFNYNTPRTDSEFSTKRLDNICVYDTNGKLIKKVEFYYSYFQADLGGFPPGTYPFYRLKLTGFSETSNIQGVSTKKDYAFEYNTAIEIPKIGSFAQDYWGFYNGKVNNGGLIPIETVSGSQIPLTMNILDWNSTWNIGNADRSVDISKMQMGILKKITYPTKGYAEFEFEPHAYLSSSTQIKTYGGGLRVSDIKNYLEDGQPAMFESFKYGIAENGIGEKLFDETLFFKNYDDTYQESEEKCLGASANGWVTAWQRTYLGVETYSAINYSGVPVIYKEISKYSGTDNNYLNKSKFEWDLLSDPQVECDDFINSGNYGFINQIWNQPNLKSETHYKRTGSILDSIQKNEYVYDLYYAKNEYGTMLKEKHKYKDPGLGCYALPGTGPQPTYILSKEYKYKSNAYRMKQKKSILYYPESSTSSETVSNYFYDNPIHMQLTETKTTTSDGKTIITKIYYPDDVNIASDLGFDPLSIPEFNAIKKLQKPTSSNLTGQHRIAMPIQTKTTVKDGSTTLSTMVQRTNYNDWGNNLVLPEFVQTLKGDYDQTNNPLEDRIQYHNYDDKGNPLEVSKKDGAHIVYIWGYKEQYPVAKIENATYSQVAATLTSTELTNIKEGTYSDATMRSKLNKIRTSLTDSQVTTYTYEPLVGVTSITDPRDYTIYYEYDDFNRLKFVKDAEGNIVSKNEYQYKDQ